MFDLEIGGKKVKAKVTFYTAQLYEAEFRSDLISDFFGVQEDQSIIEVEDGAIAKIDFTKTNWLATAKVLWAAVKTAKESTPGYAQWMKNTSGLNLWLVREQLASEVSDCFFRSGSAEEGDEQEV